MEITKVLKAIADETRFKMTLYCFYNIITA
jgi:hypothetical protein